MGIRKLRWRFAALVAFLIGVPLVEQAQASDTGAIVGGVFGLVAAIVDVAGNS
jgi:hypothetical protein